MFFSSFSIILALIRPFLGRAFDRWGRRSFLLLGGGDGLSMLAFSMADLIIILTPGRFLQGTGSAFLWIAACAMIADLSPVDSGRHEFGAIDKSIYRGGIIGTSIGFTVVLVL